MRRDERGQAVSVFVVVVVAALIVTAVLAARAYLAGSPGVTGSVEVSGGVVTVSTAASEPTLFLSAIGIGSVRAEGRASAVLVASGER